MGRMGESCHRRRKLKSLRYRRYWQLGLLLSTLTMLVPTKNAKMRTFIGGPYCTKIREGKRPSCVLAHTYLIKFDRTMIFSTPYYSSLSLLPNDPPPFTVPSTLPSTSNSKPIRKSKDNQPNVSLEDYPLPDGNWRWVSKTWMVDMQDDGSVQHDGFEYNWFFRSKNWRAKVGTLGAGGWVRRRRWLRLMMRPALGSSGEHDGASEWGTRDEVRTIPDRGSEAGSSVVSAHGKDDIVWRGDDGDWARCHYVLKRLERDGRKLELWKMWIGTGTEKTKAKDKQRQWTEDEGPLPSELASALDVPSRAPMSSLRPDLDHVAAVLGSHVSRILLLIILLPTSAATGNGNPELVHISSISR